MTVHPPIIPVLLTSRAAHVVRVTRPAASRPFVMSTHHAFATAAEARRYATALGCRHGRAIGRGEVTVGVVGPAIQG
jgi:hypothetical protein